MRVGIFTFPNSTSYGASLQMYALYCAVKSLGCECEIINYQNVHMKEERHTKAAVHSGKLRRFIRRTIHWRQRWGFGDFEKKMDKYPKDAIKDAVQLRTLGKRYDKIICGSDQVWNPDITGNDLSYYLDFCEENTRRISYAPSFGVEMLSKEFAGKVKRELEKFWKLSIREMEGQNILYGLIGKKVPLVLDPTFLLDREAWINEERVHPAAKEPYILYYTVSSSERLMQLCKELAAESKRKIVVIGGNIFRKALKNDENVEYACDIEPREWLYLMHHAECIVTNSFHGTAFSINYQKDFYVEFSSLTNSRLEHIIRITGLQARVVRDGCDPWDKHIDYEKVNDVLKDWRDVSGRYLKEAVIGE